MGFYSLHRTQFVPISAATAWEFLSNPANLIEMTPKSMNFRIASEIDRPLYAGQILQYKVSPFPGFNTRWISEITQVEPHKYFIDVQLQGPYAYWHHQHFIHEKEKGVVLEDIIHYKVPLGWLGQLLHPWIVKPKLEKIFAYRQQQIQQRFGSF